MFLWTLHNPLEFAGIESLYENGTLLGGGTIWITQEHSADAMNIFVDTAKIYDMYPV